MVSVVRFSFFGKIHIMEHFLQNIYIIFANFVHYKNRKNDILLYMKIVLRNIF